MQKTTFVAAIALSLASFATPQFATTAAAQTYCGRASWYALHSRTASGEMMDPSEMTAAHKTLKLGSTVKVTNLSNGRTVTVRINDRGPYAKGRILDLSRGAAKKLGFVKDGHTRIQIDTATGNTKDCA